MLDNTRHSKEFYIIEEFSEGQQNSYSNTDEFYRLWEAAKQKWFQVKKSPVVRKVTKNVAREFVRTLLQLLDDDDKTKKA